MTPGDTKKGGDDLLLAGLLHGLTLEAAAQQAGVSKSTAVRRSTDPAFRQRLAEARRVALERAINGCCEGAVWAMVTLRQLCTDAKQEHVRLAAARALLDQATRGVETLDLVARIEQLEAQVASAASTQSGRRR